MKARSSKDAMATMRLWSIFGTPSNLPPFRLHSFTHPRQHVSANEAEPARLLLAVSCFLEHSRHVYDSQALSCRQTHRRTRVLLLQYRAMCRAPMRLFAVYTSGLFTC